MNNRLLFILLFAVISLQANPAWSQHEQHIAPLKETIEVSNKICPVSGEKIGSMGDAVKYTYKGKTYNLCCPMCVKEFDKNPEKYSKIAEEEKPKAIMKEKEHTQEHKMKSSSEGMEKILHYTCGMHPSVKVSVENYNNGDTKCPICFMPLTPVNRSGAESGKFGENVVSKVAIKARELKLAGVKTEPAVRRELFKEIRAVGKVAYDPKLAIAQDEYISAIKSLEKAQAGGLEEIRERADSLVESAGRKLRLLGLSKEQIKELAETKKVQQNLVLPEDKMWIYGDVYEYELNWVKEGAYIKVVPIGGDSEDYYGEIISLNPVVDPQTRSVRFRALVDNPGQKLKPEMYVDIEIMSQYTDQEGKREVLSIPKSALLDTGRRKIVWVDKGNGDFEGRRVEVGPEAIDHSSDPRKYYPVQKGIEEGERVVTKGNFLIDSQSQITGVASSAYGGALGDEQKDASKRSLTGHVH